MDVDCYIYCISVIYVGIISDFFSNAEKFDLCQHESRKIQCSVGDRIVIETMEQTMLQSRCRGLSIKHCKPDFTLMKNKCNGHQSCSLNGIDFSSSACTVYPRYISATYTCISSNFGFLRVNPYNSGVCISLSRISCPGLRPMSNFAIQRDTEIYERCDNTWANIATCLTQQFTFQCNGKKHCDKKAQNDWCFIFPYSIQVSYRCVEGIVYNSANNTHHTATVDASTEKENIIPKGSSFPVIPDLSGTPDIPSISGVAPPADISDHSDITFNYGILLASVGCGLLLAGIVISIYCFRRHKAKSKKENDTNTRQRRFALETFNTENSNTDSVAGDGEYSEISPLQNVSNSSSDINAIQRSSGLEAYNLPTGNGDYSVISPLQDVNYSSCQNEENAYFILEPNAKYYKPEMSSNKNNNTAIHDAGYSDVYENDQYAMTSEGVYDVTNDRRHKESNNIYSHTADDVYDTSSHNTRSFADVNYTYS